MSPHTLDRYWVNLEYQAECPFFLELIILSPLIILILTTVFGIWYIVSHTITFGNLDQTFFSWLNFILFYFFLIEWNSGDRTTWMSRPSVHLQCRPTARHQRGADLQLDTAFLLYPHFASESAGGWRTRQLMLLATACGAQLYLSDGTEAPTSLCGRFQQMAWQSTVNIMRHIIVHSRANTPITLLY